MNRPPPLRPRGRRWILPVLLVSLLAGHGAVLYYVTSHLMLTAAALAGVGALLVMKHVGLLGRVHARFRRRPGGDLEH